MTVSATTSRWSYTGDGLTTVFPFDNMIFATSDLKVYLDGVLQASGYTIAGLLAETGGSVTFAAAPAAAVTVLLERDVPATQGATFPRAGAFDTVAMERALDRLTVLAQQAQAVIDRSLRQAAGDPNPIGEIERLADFFGKLLAFDGAGTPIPVDTSTPALASGMAYIAAGAGAESVPVDDILDEVVYARAYGFKTSNSGADNRTALLAAIVAAQNRTLRLPPGTFLWAGGPANFNGVGRVIGAGRAATTIDPSGDSTGTYTGGYVWGWIGAGLTDLGLITGAVAAGGLTVGVADSSSLSQFDVCILADPTDSSYSAVATHFRKGEFFIVESQAAGTITQRGKSGWRQGYGTAAKVHKVGYAVPECSGFQVKGVASGHASAATIAPLMFDLCVGGHVERVRGYGTKYAGISYSRCFGTTFTNCIGRNEAAGGSSLDYGIAGGNSQAVTLERCEGDGVRHGLTLGGSNIAGAVVNRDVKYIDCISRNHTAGPPLATDLHGNCEDCVIEGGEHHGGVQMGGDRNTLRKAKVWSNAGRLVYLSGMKGVNFTIEDNDFYLRDAPGSDGGALGTGGDMPSTCDAGGTFIVRGNRFTLTGTPANNFNLIYPFSQGATGSFDLVVEGNVVDASAVASWASANNATALHVRQSSGSHWRRVFVNDNVFTGLGVLVNSFSELYVDGHRQFGSRSDGLSITKSLGSRVMVNDTVILDAGTTGLSIQGASGNLVADVTLSGVVSKNCCARTTSGSSVTDTNLYLRYLGNISVANDCEFGGTNTDQDYPFYIYDCTTLTWHGRDFGDDGGHIQATTVYFEDDARCGAASVLQFATTGTITDLRLRAPQSSFANDFRLGTITNFKEFRKKGTGTFNFGAAARTFSHNIGDNNADKAALIQQGHFFITFGGTQTAADSHWIDTITRTQFNLNFDTDPTTANVPFAWEYVGAA